MSPSAHVRVQVDLSRVRANLGRVASLAPGVEILPVVKADAYGLGAREITGALRPHVTGFCLFSLSEAVDLHSPDADRHYLLVIGPPQSLDHTDYEEHRVVPAVSTAQQARALKQLRHGVELCVDVGMQRFGCPPEEVDDVLRAGNVVAAFTHATRIEHVERLTQVFHGRDLPLHAAGTALLTDPRAHLDRVRPGLALYRDATRVTVPLLEVRDSRGPIGYSGWQSATGRHGVIVAGYSNGLRPGPCAVNGERRRVAEVGMQSAFVEIGPRDRVGDEVVLLGDEVPVEDVARAWQTSPQEVLVRMCALGNRTYANV